MNASNLEDAYSKFLRDVPLDGIEKMALMRAVSLTLNGFDARKEFDIKPQHGPRPQFSQKRVGMAAQYFALCEVESNEKLVAQRVGKDWGIKSLSYIRAAAREYQQTVEHEAERVGWDRVMELAEGMRRMPNILNEN